MDDVLKDEVAGARAAAVVDDGAAVQRQLRRTGDGDVLVKGDGDGDQIASVVAAIGRAAADSGDRRCGFIDIGDRTDDNFFSRQASTIGCNNREGVGGFGSFEVKCTGLGNSTRCGIDREARNITGGCFQRVGDAGADVEVVGGDGVINNGAGAVFRDRYTCRS